MSIWSLTTNKACLSAITVTNIYQSFTECYLQDGGKNQLEQIEQNYVTITLCIPRLTFSAGLAAIPWFAALVGTWPTRAPPQPAPSHKGDPGRQTDRQTDGRIAVSLNAPLRRGNNNVLSISGLVQQFGEKIVPFWQQAWNFHQW